MKDLVTQSFILHRDWAHFYGCSWESSRR